ncbi:MAG: hypothetical protein P8H13_03795 [Polaribacter sp.]|nr:hypothetical protein [Polaribacter sp.]MDG1811046.1 hypothetical protein [Polaribacter sp.]MDG1993043.1 hypothetical protein [Polaribacter sp.]
MRQLIILLLLPLIVVSQTIQGTYTYRKSLDTQQIHLEDSTFIRSQGSAFDHGAFLNIGTYKIKNDTVFLQYESWKNKSSTFKIIKKKKIKEENTSLIISVFDMKDSIIDNLYLIYSLKSKNNHLANITQEKSNTITFWKSNNTITEIIINVFHYRGVLIPLQKFSGWHTELKVNLLEADGNTYHNDLRKEKYYWNKKTQSLHFINNKEEQTITFKKAQN